MNKILEKYARKPRREPLVKPVSTKLTDREYESFSEYVKNLGLTVSEALRLLVVEELKGSQTNKKREVDVDHPPVNRYDTEAKTSGQLSVYPRNTRKYLNQFKVDNKLPCPICERWISTKKFSTAHAKKHDNLSSADFLFKYEKEALVMVHQKNTREKLS